MEGDFGVEVGVCDGITQEVDIVSALGELATYRGDPFSVGACKPANMFVCEEYFHGVELSGCMVEVLVCNLLLGCIIALEWLRGGMWNI